MVEELLMIMMTKPVTNEMNLRVNRLEAVRMETWKSSIFHFPTRRKSMIDLNLRRGN